MIQSQPLTDTLNEVSQMFEAWRRTRQGRRQIPGELWAKAVRLAAQDGVHKTSIALRLNHGVLKRRMKTLALNAAGNASGATFMELFSAPSAVIAECAMEVESLRGSRLRVEMKHATAIMVSSIIRDFVG